MEKELLLNTVGIILDIATALGILALARLSLQSVAALKGFMARGDKIGGGLINKAEERVSRGRKLREQGKEQARQRAFLERAATGRGLRGRMFRASSKLSMGAEARSEMMESLTSSQEKMREQRLSTIRTSLGRGGGSKLTAHLAQMNNGESADGYRRRLMKGTARQQDIASRMSAADISQLDELAKNYSSQLGTTDFRIASLQSAHLAGADYDQVSEASEVVAKQLFNDASGTTAVRASKANNTMIETLAATAKQGGFTGLGYAGLDANGQYNDYAIKLNGGSATNAGDVARAATGVVKSMNLEGMETNQLGKYDSASGTWTMTDLGEALYRDATDPKYEVITANRIAQVLRQPKAKHRDELLEIVKRAGPAFQAEVDRIIAGKT